jgi:hypothetical protein
MGSPATATLIAVALAMAQEGRLIQVMGIAQAHLQTLGMGMGMAQEASMEAKAQTQATRMDTAQVVRQTVGTAMERVDSKTRGTVATEPEALSLGAVVRLVHHLVSQEDPQVLHMGHKPVRAPGLTWVVKTAGLRFLTMAAMDNHMANQEVPLDPTAATVTQNVRPATARRPTTVSPALQMPAKSFQEPAPATQCSLGKAVR